MKNMSIKTGVAAFCLVGGMVSANAYNITINDQQTPNASHWGAPGVGRGGEDQETEPGTAAAQSWDLEAFTLNGKSLKIYTGYNLLTGNNPYGTGDLFIDVNGDANWKPGADNSIFKTTDNSIFKYDYVVHFTGRVGITVSGNYDVYRIASTADVKLLETKFKSGSNPWVLDVANSKSGLTKVGAGNLTLTANTAWKIQADGTDLIGGSTRFPHYISSSIDLGFLQPGELNNKTLFHLTMECGNDTLVGLVPDGGMTFTLLGAAMAGLCFMTRRQKS